MKKEKRSVSKIGSGSFSFNKQEINIDKIFEGYPDFNMPYGEVENAEADSIVELEHTLKILKWSDEHPPQINAVQARSIYFCIVFESREQKNSFLQECDLFHIGDKYIAGEDFADAFEIDLNAGKRNKKASKKGMAFSTMKIGSSLNFGQSSLTFDKKNKKPEISEKLKGIRADEKQLAKYMEWCADPEYWICLCFRNEQEKTNMLKALNLELEYNNKYLWCYDVAKSLNVELIPCNFLNKGLYTGREKKLEDLVE